MIERDELALQPLLHTTHSSPSYWKQILKNLVSPTLLHMEQLALRTRAGEAALLSLIKKQLTAAATQHSQLFCRSQLVQTVEHNTVSNGRSQH